MGLGKYFVESLVLLGLLIYVLPVACIVAIAIGIVQKKRRLWICAAAVLILWAAVLAFIYIKGTLETKSFEASEVIACHDRGFPLYNSETYNCYGEYDKSLIRPTPKGDLILR